MAQVLWCLVGGSTSGLLLALALPPAGHWWLGPLCLVPVLVAVAGKGLLRGFIGGLCVPVALVLAVQQGLFYRLGGPEDSKWVLLGCGYFGILIVIASCFASETRLEGGRRALFLGALGVMLELGLFPILPAHLGLTQFSVPGMLTLASIGGIWLVSFAVWAANAAIADALRHRNAALGIGAILAFFLIALGAGRPWKSQAAIKVGAVQTEATDVETLRRLNAVAGAAGAQIVVWPEFAGIELAPNGDPIGLRDLSAEAGQPAFVTSYRDSASPMPHNTAALFDHGSQSALYFKRKVFGGEKSMHTPGTRAVAVRWRDRGIGLNICYDSCYPRMVGETAAAGAELIALPTIDPDSVNYFVAATHAAFTPFRAAESGVPIVRADGSAFSMAVEAHGRIVKQLGPGEAVLVASLPLGRIFTVYSVLGDWALWVCGVILLFEIGLKIWGRRRDVH